MYDDWPSLEEVVESTGVSKRTIQRKIEAGEIHKAYRNVPGRKPLPVLDPQDAAKLSQQTLKPIPVPKDIIRKQETSIAPRNDIAALAQFLAPLAVIGLDRKDYLSLKEAAVVSGLPRAYLKRKVKEGVLPAVKLPAWRIRREDLRNFRP
jgi:excisionase family DNA binding protein